MKKKLGLHANNYSPLARNAINKGNGSWGILKFLNSDEESLVEIRKDNPQAIIVCRRMINQDGNEEEMAQAILTESQTVKGIVDYWELYNEALGDPVFYNKFNLEVTKRLQGAGLKVSDLSLAVGTPAGSDDDIRRVLDILAPCVLQADAWSYHAYGAPGVLTSSDWLALRPRKYVQLDPRYGTKPRIYSEAGIDFGVIPNSQGDTSYTNTNGYRAHGIPDEVYASQLIALGDAMLTDAMELGATIYQVGNDTDWNSFRLTDPVLDTIADYVTVGDTPVPTQPQSTDSIIAYYGMYGYPPSADSALYKYGLKPLREKYLALVAAGDPTADMENPGPCLTGEYQEVVNGEIRYRVRLTNRIIECYNRGDQWYAGAVELYLK